jgi:aryl-phospho-beta-D-glucosidase BglC (GH1 family)
LPEQAQAISLLARKYDMNCAACHTAPPILNQFGQWFFENGYQLPGREAGGIVGKKKPGEVTLDDVRNYLGDRLAGNTTRSWSFKKQKPFRPRYRSYRK